MNTRLSFILATIVGTFSIAAVDSHFSVAIPALATGANETMIAAGGSAGNATGQVIDENATEIAAGGSAGNATGQVIDENATEIAAGGPAP